MTDIIAQTQARLARIRRDRTVQNAAWDAEERDLIEQFDQLRTDARPEYPTPEHHAAIAEIAKILHSGLTHAPGDFLGEPVLDDPSVLFAASSSRINVFAHAPRAEKDHGPRLWRFSADEEAAFRRLIEHANLTIRTSWRHDDGIAFIVDAHARG